MFCTPSLCSLTPVFAQFLLSCIVKLQLFLEDGYFTPNFRNPREKSEVGKDREYCSCIDMEGAGDLVFFYHSDLFDFAQPRDWLSSK